MSALSWLCAVVAGLALAHAIDGARRLRHSRRLPAYVGRAQQGRRVVGSALVALLMLLVYLGLEVVEPFAAPRLWLLLWAVNLFLVLVLLLLAYLDLRELRAHRDIARARAWLKSQDHN